MASMRAAGSGEDCLGALLWQARAPTNGNNTLLARVSKRREKMQIFSRPLFCSITRARSFALLCCCGQGKRRTSLSFLKRSPSSRSHCWHAVACCCPQTRRNRRPTPKLEAPPRRQRETLAKWAPFALCADACLMWLHCIGTSANAKLTQITLRWSEGESNWIATPSEVSLSLSASRPLSHNPARPATSVGEKS